MDRKITQTASVHDLAYYMGISPRRVQQLAQQGIIPAPYERGKYNFTLCLREYITYLRNLVATFSGMQSEFIYLSRRHEEDIK